MNTIVLYNVVIIDGSGCDPIEGGVVVVEGQRINDVFPGSPGSLPAAAITLDCKGQTLLPGLIDAHVHMGAVEAALTEQQRRNFTSVLVIKTVRNIKET